MAFGTGYNPPGIYVEDVSRPIVTASGAITSLACIIGPSRGYQQYVEEITLTDITINGDVTSGSDVITNVSNISSLKVGLPISGAGIPVDTVIDSFAVDPEDGNTITLSNNATDTDTEVELTVAGYANLYYTGVIANTVVVKNSAGTPLVDGEYSLLIIPDVPDLGAETDTTLVVRIDGGSPTNIDSTNKVVVSYNYVNLGYFVPGIYSDYFAVSAQYGDAFTIDPITKDATINSPLTTAAKIAFDNGATQIMLVATNSNIGNYSDQLEDAYLKISSDYHVGVVVPLLTVSADSTMGDSSSFEAFCTSFQASINAASTAGFGRIGIVGAPATLVDDLTTKTNIELHTALAQNLQDKRIVVAYPNRVNLAIAGAKPILAADGSWLAVAYAGMLASNKPNRGLTKQIVSGFTSFPYDINLWTQNDKNNLSSSGVAVTEIDRLSRFTIRHGVSTDMRALNYREISLTRISDALFQSVYNGLENADLIGEPITYETTSEVKSILSGILERAKDDEIIVDWQNLLVRQETAPTGDPTVIDCKFAYLPAIPLNYINVEFSIDLNSGTVTETPA